MDDLDPGLQGYSDSGSDFHDLPEPVLPKGLRKTCLEASDGGVTLKRPADGDAVLLRCRPCPEALKHLLDDQGLLSLELCTESRPWLIEAAKTLRLAERARFEGPLLADLDISGIELTLVDWIVRCDLFEDASAAKSVVRRPDDRRRPIIGQICQVSLEIASWRVELQYQICDLVPPESEHRWERGARPAEGWKLLDKALLSMRRGEKSRIQCTAERLEEGATVAVPKGQEMWLLNVELHDFIETSDVSFEKDGSVQKRSVHCRDANVRCQALGTCHLHLASGSTEREEHAVLGQGQLSDALEASVRQMREHEVAEITADARLCDWPSGLDPSVASVSFKLEVRKYEPGAWERATSDEDKLQVLAVRKEQAVRVLKMGRWGLAASHFHDIHQLLGYIDDFRGLKSGAERATRVQELKETCLLNRALCCIKAKNFEGALRACDLVLDGACTRATKARLRRAQANLGLDDCAEALRDCQRLLGSDVELEAKRLDREVRQRQKVLDTETKNLYDKMCSGLGRLPHPLDVD